MTFTPFFIHRKNLVALMCESCVLDGSKILGKLLL